MKRNYIFFTSGFSNLDSEKIFKEKTKAKLDNPTFFYPIQSEFFGKENYGVSLDRAKSLILNNNIELLFREIIATCNDYFKTKDASCVLIGIHPKFIFGLDINKILSKHLQLPLLNLISVNNYKEKDLEYLYTVDKNDSINKKLSHFLTFFEENIIYNEKKCASTIENFSQISFDDAFNYLFNKLDNFSTNIITPLKFEYELFSKAKSDKKTIVLPEGSDDRILKAADILLKNDIVNLIILSDQKNIKDKKDNLNLNLENAKIIDPKLSELHEKFANNFFELRKNKGITQEKAREVMFDVNYFGTMLVHEGLADGMVSGAIHTTGDTIRPALQIIKTVPGTSIVSSIFLMALENEVLVYGDCAINPNPTPDELAQIAIISSSTAKSFGLNPKVAMLSYSTGSSGKGEDVDLVIEATKLVKEKKPDLEIEGPIQYDAAVDADVAKVKLPNSLVAGRANVFIFPDLQSGNIAYKAVQRSASALAIGPILQGIKKPINDLSRGCLVEDIVNTVAITAIQAQSI